LEGEENLNFKILLVTDNCPGHQRALTNLSKNITVLFFIPNTTPLLQSMDQSLITTFKAYYLHRTSVKLTKATDEENEPSVKEVWKMLILSIQFIF
jgi:hypothetical protein